MTKKEIAAYLEKIDKIIPIEQIRKMPSDTKAVVEYYSKANLFYRKMHSEQGAVHFPVYTKESTSHAERLLYQAISVGKIIEKTGAKKVLELGCGMGFNSVHLAKKYKNCEFLGLDLTPKHVHFANKFKEGIANVSFREGNFDKLNLDDKYDVIFAVETLCHSNDLVKLLSYASQVLAPKGKIIIFDGYGTKESETAMVEDETLKIVSELFAQGFVIQSPQVLSLYDEVPKQSELKIEEILDISENILPNFDRFQKGSILLLKFPYLTKFFMWLKIIPKSVFLHSLAGLFGPFLLENGYTSYNKVVLSK